MRIYFYSLLTLLSLHAGVVAGQNDDNKPWCGTKGITSWFDFYRQNREYFAAERGDSDTAWLYVPVTIQIVGNDNGGGYYPLELALLSVCQMNDHFAQARIKFYLQPGDPYRYLNNSTWYEHNWDGGADLIESNRIPNRLNTFIVADPAGNCGYSWIDAIVMAKGCSGPGNRTWAHEAGHHLSLPHPFYGWEGFEWDYSQPAPEAIGNGPWANEVEKMDFSNCYNSGDYFCDTRPDYLNYRWNCDGNGESLVLQHDPDGVPFRSDGRLIMGYSSDACGALFTEEQIEAMRSNLYTEHSSYLQVTEAPAPIDPEASVQLSFPLDSQAVQYNDFTLHWNPVPNATMYTVDISLINNNSFQPRLLTKTVYNTTSLTVSGGLPNNRTLFWRVRPYSEWDLCKSTAPQQIGIFKTKDFSATNDLEAAVYAELSPNPVSADYPAQLMLTADDNLEAVLSVIDAAGRTCQQQNVQLSFGENLVEIPTDALQSGLYIISLHNEKGTILKRLAVAK